MYELNGPEMHTDYDNDSKVCHSIRASINKVIEMAPYGSIFVESGCYLGNTTKHLVQKLLDSDKRFTFYAIDNWKLDNVTEKHDDNFDFFKKNVGKLIEHVNIISMDSLEAIKEFEDNSVYYCFLDDCHVYEHVTKQIGLWLPKMKDFSILSGDDYYSKHVSQAVHDYFEHKDIHPLFRKAGFLVYNPKSKVISKEEDILCVQN